MPVRTLVDLHNTRLAIEGLRRVSDRLVGMGPFGIGLDGLLGAIPVLGEFLGAIYSVGAGVMSAAGSQLALMVIDDREKKAAPAAPAQAPQVAKKPANAQNALPPGALESALARAQARLALEAHEAAA